MIETAAATVLFVFLPTRWIEKIESVLNPSTVIHSQEDVYKRQIEATLDGITPLNAEKKKEEALAMLKK